MPMEYFILIIKYSQQITFVLRIQIESEHFPDPVSLPEGKRARVYSLQRCRLHIISQYDLNTVRGIKARQHIHASVRLYT